MINVIHNRSADYIDRKVMRAKLLNLKMRRIISGVLPFLNSISVGNSIEKFFANRLIIERKILFNIWDKKKSFLFSYMSYTRNMNSIYLDRKERYLE